MSWYQTPDSLGRPAMSDLLPTDLPAVFFCVPSVLASKLSAVSRRGSPGLTRRRRSTWDGHGPVDDRTRCQLPSHSSPIFARCVELCSTTTCPCPPSTAVAVAAQTPIRRSAVQTRGLERRASQTRHPFQSELHHAQRPTLQHLLCLFFLFLGFLDLLASKPLIRLPALLTARLLLHHHVLICLTRLFSLLC